MGKIHLSKIKGKNNMELKVGDVVLETNRFDKNDYMVHQILEIDEHGSCKLKVLRDFLEPELL